LVRLGNVDIAWHEAATAIHQAERTIAALIVRRALACVSFEEHVIGQEGSRDHGNLLIRAGVCIVVNLEAVEVGADLLDEITATVGRELLHGADVGTLSVAAMKGGVKAHFRPTTKTLGTGQGRDGFCASRGSGAWGIDIELRLKHGLACRSLLDAKEGIGVGRVGIIVTLELPPVHGHFICATFAAGAAAEEWLAATARALERVLYTRHVWKADFDEHAIVRGTKRVLTTVRAFNCGENNRAGGVTFSGHD